MKLLFAPPSLLLLLSSLSLSLSLVSSSLLWQKTCFIRPKCVIMVSLSLPGPAGRTKGDGEKVPSKAASKASAATFHLLAGSIFCQTTKIPSPAFSCVCGLKSDSPCCCGVRVHWAKNWKFRPLSFSPVRPTLYIGIPEK